MLEKLFYKRTIMASKLWNNKADVNKLKRVGGKSHDCDCFYFHFILVLNEKLRKSWDENNGSTTGTKRVIKRY